MLHWISFCRYMLYWISFCSYMLYWISFCRTSSAFLCFFMVIFHISFFLSEALSVPVICVFLSSIMLTADFIYLLLFDFCFFRLPFFPHRDPRWLQWKQCLPILHYCVVFVWLIISSFYISSRFSFLLRENPVLYFLRPFFSSFPF
jgi:hypothetical protein